MSIGKYDVEKFNGKNNFGMWQCEVLDVLAKENLEEALSVKPEEMTEENWRKLNRQACGSIRLCLAKEQKYFVMRETFAVDLWKKLEDKFMTKSIQNKLFLMKRLFRMNMKSGVSLSEHLDEFNRLLADLLNLDEAVPENYKALSLLNSLPDEYEHLVTTLLTGKEYLEYDEVTIALLNHEYRRKDIMVHRDASTEALMVRGRSNDRKSGGFRSSRSKSRSSFKAPSKDECAYCRQKGHWVKDCPKVKGKEKMSNVNIANDPDTDSDKYSLSISALICSTDEWIIDSGCTYHVS